MLIKLIFKNSEYLEMASQMRFLNYHYTNFATNVGPSNFVTGLIEYVFLVCLAILFVLGSGTDTSRWNSPVTSYRSSSSLPLLSSGIVMMGLQTSSISFC